MNGTNSAQKQRPLLGRTAVITGGNRGLGLEIAGAYVDAGANVMVCARDADLLEAAGAALKRRAETSVIWRTADVTDEPQVNAVIEEAVSKFGSIQILVNNAGVYGPFGLLEDVDLAEWSRAIEINLRGSVLPIRAALPHFKAQAYGKIIQLSGGGATNPLPRISSYAASKAAVVRLAETVAEECRDYNIDVNSIAPGALNTRLLDDVLAAGPDKVGAAFFARAVRQKEEGGADLRLSSELSVFLASSASDGITGRLISALWDDWRIWPDHLADLSASDIYTLRRIVGRDRGMNWGDK
jgi:3-oxoacyl-[acyl-carrier protein] reductase